MSGLLDCNAAASAHGFSHHVGETRSSSLFTQGQIHENRLHPHPSHALLECFDAQLYAKFRKRCLEERNKIGARQSKEMSSLYRFWSYHLRTSFDRTMYREFKGMAQTDATQADFKYGMECLFRFYSYGLEIEFRAEVYEDFEELTLQTWKQGELYGLEKYWAFHRYRSGRDKDSKPLRMHPQLEELLTNQFRSIEDFTLAKVQI